MKDFFTVGELADLFAVDVQTLRYYDKIGLLVPSMRNPENGYRLYKFDQVYQVASIRYLKRLGYSLEQIRQYLDSRTVDRTMEHLKAQSKLLRQRWQELINIDSAIQRKLEFVQQELPEVELDKIKIKTFGDRYYIHIGSEEILYGTDVFYFHPTLVFYQGGTKYFGAYLFEYDPQDEKLPSPNEVSILKAGSFLCGYHHGPYETISTAFDRIREKGKNLKLADWQVNFNILDQFVESDNNQFITEIQIPILDA